MIKGYLLGHATGVQCVGAKDTDTDDPKDLYEGPQARVSFDDDWLHIVTDEQEGNVVLNIEALPQLRRALARIAHRIASKAQTEQPA